MKSLALKILAWQTKQNLKKKAASKRKNIPFAQSKKIGILFSIQDIFKHEAVKHFVHLLKQDKKEVIILAFLGEGKENFEFKYDFFSLKDLTLLGELKSENIQSFIAEDFDFLFHIDPEEENIMMDNILSKSRASCRIGICPHEEKTSLYEFLYKPAAGKDLKETIEEVLKYTKALNKV